MRFAGASPLGLFSQCHARTLEECLDLRKLVLLLRETGWSTRAQQASRDILRHFDQEATQNHVEEEACLFPALLDSMAGTEPDCLREMTSTLARQHSGLERMWARLRPQLEAICTGQSAALSSADVEDFIEANVRHIESEENGLLPMAQRLIAGRELPRLRSSILQWRTACNEMRAAMHG
ncbi:MAG: hemerythrin domain-containing protein [Ramlibacter sp.]|nr:hemerythrin domain-containing protein [Ramlibacter sp.]